MFVNIFFFVFGRSPIYSSHLMTGCDNVNYGTSSNIRKSDDIFFLSDRILLPAIQKITKKSLHPIQCDEVLEGNVDISEFHAQSNAFIELIEMD